MSAKDVIHNIPITFEGKIVGWGTFGENLTIEFESDIFTKEMKDLFLVNFVKGLSLDVTYVGSLEELKHKLSKKGNKNGT